MVSFSSFNVVSLILLFYATQRLVIVEKLRAKSIQPIAKSSVDVSVNPLPR